MKNLIVALAIVALTWGVAGAESGSTTDPVGIYVVENRDGVCRHNALYQASVFGDYYPIRIMVGPSTMSNSKEWHAQTQAFIAGKWRWLRNFGTSVYVASQDAFTPKRKYSTVEFAKYQFSEQYAVTLSSEHWDMSITGLKFFSSGSTAFQAYKK